MNFGEAVEALNDGKLVNRLGWNCNGLFIYKTIANVVAKDFISKFTSLPQSVKEFLFIKDKDVVFRPSITMYTEQGYMQPGWLPSQEDILAEDWNIIPLSHFL